MPVTQLDPKTALIVVDLQKGIRNFPGIHSFDEIIKNAAILLEEFRKKGLPVVLVNVNGVAPGRSEHATKLPAQLPAEFFEFVDELNKQPTDYVVTKKTWGAFTNTDLEAHLKKLGVTQVVVCGVSTSAGVESTARSAHELGFNVTIATDAITDGKAESHENSINRVFPRLGETGVCKDIIDLVHKL